MSGSNVIIRSGRPGDAAAIAAMLGRLAEEVGDGERFASNERTIRLYGFGDAAHFQTQIAVDADGHPAGLVLYYPHFSTTRGVPGLYVQDLWIDPDLRGSGAVRALLSAACAHTSRQWNAGYLALTVHGHNDAAAAFYAGLGFVAAVGDRPMALEGEAFASLTSQQEVSA